MFTAYDVYLLREFELWLCFTDDTVTDGNRRHTCCGIKQKYQEDT